MRHVNGAHLIGGEAVIIDGGFIHITAEESRGDGAGVTTEADGRERRRARGERADQRTIDISARRGAIAHEHDMVPSEIKREREVNLRRTNAELQVVAIAAFRADGDATTARIAGCKDGSQAAAAVGLRVAPEPKGDGPVVT